MKDKPRIPNIGEYVRHHGTLVDIEIIEPPPQPPPQKDYIFEEVNSRCETRLGNDVLNKWNHVNDFYGKETSVQDSIEKAKKYAAEKGICPDHSLEVVAVKITTRRRMRPTNSENFYDKSFFDFKCLEFGSCRDLSGPVETVVWTSRNPT